MSRSGAGSGLRTDGTKSVGGLSSTGYGLLSQHRKMKFGRRNDFLRILYIDLCSAVAADMMILIDRYYLIDTTTGITIPIHIDIDRSLFIV